MAKGIIFQTQETQLFLIIPVQATTTSLTKDNFTQLTTIKERDKCQRDEAPLQWIIPVALLT